MKKYLKDVTLLAYTSHEVEGTVASLQECQKDIKFAEVKLLSHEKPNNLPSNITYEYAPEINDINDFNHYMFLELGKHVSTSHMLYVQAHAWILHPELWNDDWLQYDYCGSPWRIVENAYIANNGKRARVGNGGFSLRSKKLLDLPKNMNWELRQEQSWYNEDGNVCCYWRKEMLENGIKYAPIEVASIFSYENPMKENNYGNIKTFGFHRRIPNG